MVFTSNFISGFDAVAFFRRRILRIYPIYWICAGMYLIGHAMLGLRFNLSAIDFLGAIFLFPDFSFKIIGPGWTLSYEVFFYLCFGLFMTAGLNRGLVLLGISFAFLVALGIVLPFDTPLWNFVTNSLLLEFLAGSAIGWLFTRNHLPHRGGGFVTILALSLFAAGILFGYDRFPSALMWGVPSALLIAGAVMMESKRQAPLWVQKVGYFGDSSYALYLIHLLVITIALQLSMKITLPIEFPPAVLAGFISIVALAIAEILHHRIEKPLLRTLNSRRRIPE